jgi:hypothetical protein
MTNLQTKIQLEVLKVKIAINSEMVSEEVWKRTDVPHMHEYYLKQLNEDTQQYLELLREVLVPNKTYVMDMGNPIMAYDDKNHIVPFLYKHMVYGEYKSYGDDYLYDSSKPFLIHRYSDYGGETMDDNKAEIIECLHASPFTFLVDDKGNTIINGRPYNMEYYLVSYSEEDKINVISNKNIFHTDLIANISLSSL